MPDIHALPPHRTMRLEDAAAEFGLEEIWSEWIEPELDSLFDTFTDEQRVLVFDGDSRFDHPVSQLDQIVSGPEEEAPALSALCAQHEFIIVNGKLHAGYINTWGLRAFFVFGGLDCDKIEFHGNSHAWIQGNLHARSAVLATGNQDGSPDMELDGRLAVRVLGQARSPAVRSWWLGLSHLPWTTDSGREFREDMELDAVSHKSDPLWRPSR